MTGRKVDRRAARIIGTLAEEMLSYHFDGEFYLDLDGAVEMIDSTNSFPSIAGVIGGWKVYATRWVGPHTDSVGADYTLGIVLEGNHTLFTGTGRTVGRLSRGSVYWLKNTSLHGARSNGTESTLIFAAIDYSAASDFDAANKAMEWLERR